MAWTRTGTVNLTYGSDVVTGVGTQFLVDGRIGDGFRGPNGAIYEVVNIATNTGMTIRPAYEGNSVSGGVYFLAPIQGYVKDTADALRAASLQIGSLPASKQDKNVNLTALSALTGAANTLPYFPGVGVLSLTALTAKARELLAQSTSADMRAILFDVALPINLGGTGATTEAAARTKLGLGTASTRNVGSSLDQVMLVGDRTSPLAATINTWGNSFQIWNNTTIGYPEANQSGTALNLAWPDGAFGSQIFMSFSGEMYFRSGNYSSVTMRKVFHTANAEFDPQFSGGLMSSTLIGGYNVTRYLNGEINIRGDAPLTSQFSAGEVRTVNVQLPVALLAVAGSYRFSASASAQPTQLYDHYGVISTLLSTSSVVGVVIRAGATAQAFQPTINVWGRWK